MTTNAVVRRPKPLIYKAFHQHPIRVLTPQRKRLIHKGLSVFLISEQMIQTSFSSCLSQKVSQTIVFAFFSFAESTFLRSAPIARGMKRPAADNS